MEKSVRRPNFWSSIGGLLVACIAFAVVLFLVNAILYLLSLLRGSEISWLEKAFNELAPPAAGAYASMLVAHKICKTYSKNFVFFGFSALIIAFIAVSLILMFLAWGSGRFSVYNAVMQGLAAPVAIAGAYWGQKKHQPDAD